MIYLADRCQEYAQKQLLMLSGSIFVNSDKIQLWQHKVAPFNSKLWVWFGCFTLLLTLVFFVPITISYYLFFFLEQVVLTI